MALAWERLAFLPVADKILVMDRGSGRWILAHSTMTERLQRLAAGDDPSTDEDLRELYDCMCRAGVGGAPTPKWDSLNTLILKLTKVCNFGCKYCYDMEREDSMSHMPEDVALAALDEALRLAPRYLVVILHGGEPTLRFGHIERIVSEGERLAEEYHKVIAFTIQSNLSRLTQAMVDFTGTHRLRWGISFDGPRAINDLYRVRHDGLGTYACLEAALSKFPAFTLSCGLLSTITAANHHCLLSVARHFRDLGFRSWDWSLFQPIGMGRAEAGQFACSVPVLIQAWNELFDAVASGEFDEMQIGPVTDYLRNFILGPGSNMCQRRECGAARDLLSVSHDGTIEACDCIDRRGPFANLGTIRIYTKDALLEARQSSTAALIRSRDVTTGRCGSCTWLSVCGGTCLAYSPSLHAVYETQCAISTNAFVRIAESLATSDALKRYWNSVTKAPDPIPGSITASHDSSEAPLIHADPWGTVQ